ncbi:chemotaxis protein CheW [Sphingosinicella sp. LY1275]|uniref:chemotaxis protein CheW n=1 Tax=Sphingosinicella sp. LY1275 TaxID=3095379 RepID=UPI002ADEF499|nr:chemotaxis protein CheW [Sphingosinicella sp. LY1275]MEA1013332.1 chemotaxis protein CheW [Sphingosinicella sp. LY1275]
MQELLLIITLGGQRIAVPAADVESVVEIEGLTPVPRAAAHVAGLSALRSRVLTVIDCLASLELGASNADGPRDAIVVETDGHPYALLVDSVEDVLEFSGDVRPVRTSLDSGWRRVAKGMVEAGDDLLLLVDSQALLAGPTAQAA